MIELWAIYIILACTIIGAFGSLCFKLGADKLKELKWRNIKQILGQLINNYYLILGVFLYAVSAILYSIALKGGELSIIYPLVAISYIWVILLSKYFLKEKINNFKWMGISAIILGIIFLGIGM